MILLSLMELFINSKLKPSKAKKGIRSIALTAMLLAVLVGQEFILSSIPQVQLTVILIIVYAQFLTYSELLPMIMAYVILDSWLFGGFSLIYTPTLFVLWLLLAIVARLLRNRPDYIKFILAVVFPFVYGVSFIPANILVLQVSDNLWAYIVAYVSIDFPWEVTMAVNSILTYLVFYRPLISLFEYMFSRRDYIHTTQI